MQPTHVVQIEIRKFIQTINYVMKFIKWTKPVEIYTLIKLRSSHSHGSKLIIVAIISNILYQYEV